MQRNDRDIFCQEAIEERIASHPGKTHPSMKDASERIGIRNWSFFFSCVWCRWAGDWQSSVPPRTRTRTLQPCMSAPQGKVKTEA